MLYFSVLDSVSFFCRNVYCVANQPVSSIGKTSTASGIVTSLPLWSFFWIIPSKDRGYLQKKVGCFASKTPQSYGNKVVIICLCIPFQLFPVAVQRLVVPL